MLFWLRTHISCSSPIYTSYGKESEFVSLAESLGVHHENDIALARLLELPEPRRPKRLTLRQIQALAKKSPSRSQKAAVSQKKVIGSLSLEQTEELIKRFQKNKEEKASGCFGWSGAKSIRLFKGDGSTLVTKSPLSIATFIAFGRSLPANKVSRTCDSADCINPKHLSKIEYEPRPISSLEFMSNVFGSLEPAGYQNKCLDLVDFGKNVLINNGKTKGSTQSIALWKVLFFIAFRKVPWNHHRGLVWQKCGRFSCVNPDHLEPQIELSDSEEEGVVNSRFDRQELGGFDYKGLMQFLVFAGEAMKDYEMSESECMFPPPEMQSRVLAQFGAVSFWRYWSPLRDDDAGRVELDKTALIAALSLRNWKWAFYPTAGGIFEGPLSCEASKQCINPHHFLEEILGRMERPWHRWSFVSAFELVPQIWPPGQPSEHHS